MRYDPSRPPIRFDAEKVNAFCPKLDPHVEPIVASDSGSSATATIWGPFMAETFIWIPKAFLSKLCLY